MSTDSNPLGLYIPEQTTDFTDAPYLKPREAEKWIANLPTAHIGETARLIYEAMAKINRVPLPAQQRFKVLELFREIFGYVSQSLQKHYINQAFPLSSKNQKIAELTRELQSELAIGYKIIIEASLSQKSGRVDNKTLLTSIYRAIHYLSETLLKSYLTYTPQDNQTWLEIHHLYLFSEHNNLISENVRDNLNKNHDNLSVGSLYKQIILLSLANPYRLVQSETLRVHKALLDWSNYSHLHMLDNPNNPIGLFAIDLENNAPPSYYNTAHKQINTNFIRILDTSELTRILRDLSENYVDNDDDIDSPIKASQQNMIAQDTLRRLILAWGAVPKRSFSRKEKEEQIDITLGLSATHCYIKKDYESNRLNSIRKDDAFTDSQIAFQEKAQYSSSVVLNAGEPSQQPDIWDMASNPNLVGNNSYDFTPNDNNEDHVQPKVKILETHEEIYDIYKCLLINEAAGGYCIAWANDSTTKTIVGSLIGLKNKNESENEDNNWNIGVIRWLKTPDKQNMFVGIELLSPSAKAIASLNMSRNTNNTNYARALLLPELLTVKQPQTLITQLLYNVGDKLELDIHGRTIKVQLTKLLESSSAFKQFEFSITKPEIKATPKDKLDNIKNFDSIWSSI